MFGKYSSKKKILKKTISFIIFVSYIALSGCTNSSYNTQTVDNSSEQKPTKYKEINNPYFSNISQGNTKKEKDHAAILAMQGEYKVDFNFNETVILSQDYERFKPKTAGALETVVVVENTPERIVLQHLLIVGEDHVIKHWRQDWFFEATERFEFTSDQTWTIKTVKESQREGQWTQCVYEVSDAPRYCGTGKWNHKYGVSTWTSDRSWRPLPRREYTIREDYNALNVENRHTVTPNGWTHEQDNTKVVRLGEATEKTLVREFGFNDYRNISGFDFGPAYSYWKNTQGYWAIIREIWKDNFYHDKYIKLDTPVDGMPVIEATFKHAEEIEAGNPTPKKDTLKELLGQWINTPQKSKVNAQASTN